MPSKRTPSADADLLPADFIDFGRDLCCRQSENTRREWLVTNGLGGYASGTIGGILTRRAKIPAGAGRLAGNPVDFQPYASGSKGGSPSAATSRVSTSKARPSRPAQRSRSTPCHSSRCRSRQSSNSRWISSQRLRS
ncbi:MAG: glycogen debranching enzyme N-terminal domain-containing protein, partial [Phycisphaerales bacterium]